MTMPATASSPRIVAVHSRSTAYATVAKGNNDSSRKRHAVNLTSPFFSFAVDYSRNSRWPPPHPHAHRLIGFRLHCSDSGNSSSSSSSSSTPNSSARGFGSKPRPPSSTSSTDKKPTRMRMDDSKSSVLPIRKSSSNRSNNIPNQAPVLSSQTDGKSGNIPTDVQFEERLQAVKRSALQQKNAEEAKQYGAIDYDTPTMPKSNTVGLGTKIGAAVAALIFGLVFAFGDFIPSEKISPTEESTTVVEKVSAKEREILKKRLQEFEQMLSISQDDPTALEGAAVTLAELGEYDQAASLLEDLTKKKSSDPDVFRLLGEVKYELKDYEGSARAYRNSAMVSETIDFEVIRGLTNALLGAKKPGEAVQMLLPIRDMLNNEKNVHSNTEAESILVEKSSQLDPIQVDLLLGKAYSDWGHVSDAVAVYDQIISGHPDDFRGYLAKGIILKENGNVGGAERMFMQARFFAPEKAKALVDKYSR